MASKSILWKELPIKPLKLWILQTGEPLFCDGSNLRPMRAIVFANTALEYNYNVTIISSRFFHQKKTFRKNIKRRTLSNRNNIETILLESTGYKSNIGISRLFDHTVLAFSLIIFLLRRNNYPKAVFIGFPPIEIGFVMSFFCRIKGIPYVVDIKDLWPQLFVDSFPPDKRWVAEILFKPYFLMARYILYNSKLITCPSSGFKANIKKIYKKLNKKIVVLPLLVEDSLVSDREVDKNISKWKRILDLEDYINISFIGAFMESAYDFETVFKAFKIAKDNGIKYNLILAGSGNKLEYVKKMFAELDNIYFPGWVYHAELIALQKISNALLAPYKQILNYSGHIPNKVSDSMRASKAVITPLVGEFKQLLLKENFGYSYESNNPYTLYEVIKDISQDKKECTERGKIAKNISIDLINQTYQSSCKEVFNSF